MTEWLMLRAGKANAYDIHRGDKCTSGYSHDGWGPLESLVKNYPDFECDVSEWGKGYYRITPFFLVRWEDDQEV